LLGARHSVALMGCVIDKDAPRRWGNGRALLA